MALSSLPDDLIQQIREALKQRRDVWAAETTVGDVAWRSVAWSHMAEVEWLDELLASLASASGARTCAWSLDDEGGDSVYETQCGQAFYFDDAGSVADHGFKVCPYCGKALIEARTSDEAVPASADEQKET